MPTDTPSSPASATRLGSVETVLALLRAQGPCSQAVLARQTGLSKGTINNVVKRLLADNVVSLQQKNRKEALVTLGVGLDAIATVQVQAQRVSATLFDFARQQRFDHDLVLEGPGESSSPEAVVAVLSTLAERSGIAVLDLPCVTVAIQAAIDRASGEIVPWAASRLPAWRGINLVEELERLLGVAVLVDNDANLAALGEWTWGCGRGCEDFFYLLCAEGVGGGLVLNGRIYRGGTGVAGEVGHMTLDHTGPVCFCGARGCLHSLVSERAILGALANSDSPQLSLATVIDAARLGDAACRRVLFDAGLNLGRALANTARVIAPSVIAVGGTLSTAGEMLTDSLRSSPELQNLFSIASSTQVQIAELGDAVRLGGVAAGLAHLGRGMAMLPEWMEVSALASAQDTVRAV